MRIVFVLAAASLLTACATSPQQASLSTLKPSVYEVDYAKIAIVERQARDNWGKVVWISLPRKRVENDQAQNY
jgi:starvation-inducible outer membrane lipoprotein